MKFKFPKPTGEELKAALASGIFLGIAFPPFPFYYLLLVGLVPYLLQLRREKTLAEVNRFTYLTFFIFNLIALYWVGSWTSQADIFLEISGAVLIFFNPLLFLIPSSLYYFAKKNLNEKIAFWLFPFFWVAYEFLYSVTEFRFPWLTLGNGLAYFTSFIQSAEIIGVYGLSLLVLYSNLLFAILIGDYLSKKIFRKKAFLLVSALIIANIAYGLYALNQKEHSVGKVTVGLIQPDLNPWKKWEAGNLQQQLDIYLNLSKEAVKNGAELVVWPETALPVYLLSGSYLKYVNEIRDFVDSNKACLITGMPHAKFFRDSLTAKRYNAKKSSYGNYYYATYNSALAFQPNTGYIQQYGKIKLVPFGEKIPYGNKLPFLSNLIKWNVGISSWNTGYDTTVFKLKIREGNDTLKIAPLICIESIYPDFAAQFVRRGAELFVVVTNDSWYGNSSGPRQHEAFARIRAVENRRYVVRAANGGISCIIDEKGRALLRTPMFTRTFLVGKVELFNRTTFYTKHPLLVPYIALAITTFAFLLGLIFLIKRNVSDGKEN